MSKATFENVYEVRFENVHAEGITVRLMGKVETCAVVGQVLTSPHVSNGAIAEDYPRGGLCRFIAGKRGEQGE